MHAAERPDFLAPPPAPRLLSSLLLAIVVHSLLLVALTWGVAWKRQAQILTVEAELWAELPHEEAPAPVEPPQVEITAPLTLKVAPALPSDADIALAREKERKLKEQEEQEKAALEKQKKLEQAKQLAQEKEKEKKKKDHEAKIKAKKDAEQVEKDRKKTLDRMMGLASSSGSPSSKGSGKDAQSAGPSAGYAGRIRARIKPNIVFTDNISSNPVTEVEVRTSPDGTIVGRKIIKSSGVKSWDEAVLKAIDKTEVLPRNEDGLVFPTLVIAFRPRD